MALITGILCPVYVSDISGAGTDGRVFVGIAGREFRLDSRHDDYERNIAREYALGTTPSGTQVLDPLWNNPTLGWSLDTAALATCPRYIRFEPESGDDNLNLSFAAALVYTGENDFEVAYLTPPSFENLWLGKRSGMVIHLTEEFRDRERAAAEMRKRAAR